MFIIYFMFYPFQSMQEDNRGSPRWTVTMYLVITATICLHLMVNTFNSKANDVCIFFYNPFATQINVGNQKTFLYVWQELKFNNQ